MTQEAVELLERAVNGWYQEYTDMIEEKDPKGFESRLNAYFPELQFSFMHDKWVLLQVF